MSTTHEGMRDERSTLYLPMAANGFAEHVSSC
jgi:hypothetical protein